MVLVGETIGCMRFIPMGLDIRWALIRHWQYIDKVWI
jgi:hypothetical protein